MASDYQIRFVAVNPTTPEPGAEQRVGAALRGMPGLESPEGASAAVDGRRIEGAFCIGVDQAMAEAARDGSRLAKEALNAAGMDDAKLVELHILLPDED